MSKTWSNNKVETIQPVTVTEEKVQPVAVAPVTVDATIAEAIKSQVEAVAQPKASVATTTIAAKTTDSVLQVTEISAKRQAELDEARDVAFQVVFFFIALIFASFGLLYIYHKMEQERAMQAAGKTNQ